MASHLETFRDAKGQQVQPYYAAFMIERGYAVPGGASMNVEFMEWVQARWTEFEDATKRPHKHEGRRLLCREFGEWLAARSLDHLARHVVEGTMKAAA